jgi:hypothetical protein
MWREVKVVPNRTSAQDGDEWSSSRSDRFGSGREYGYPLNRSLGCSKSGYGLLDKIISCTCKVSKLETSLMALSPLRVAKPTTHFRALSFGLRLFIWLDNWSLAVFRFSAGTHTSIFARPAYWVDYRRIVSRFSRVERYFFLPQSVQPGPGAYPASKFNG